MPWQDGIPVDEPQPAQEPPTPEELPAQPASDLRKRISELEAQLAAARAPQSLRPVRREAGVFSERSQGAAMEFTLGSVRIRTDGLPPGETAWAVYSHRPTQE